MAHKKAAGSTRLGRDSQSKRLGIKIYGDQPAKAGEVIVRQRGLPYHPGINVERGGDDTLYALTDGLVHYRSKQVHEFTGKLVGRRFVDILTSPVSVIPDRSPPGRQDPESSQSSQKPGSRVKPGMTTATDTE